MSDIGALMQSCLSVDPSARPSLATACCRLEALALARSLDTPTTVVLAPADAQPSLDAPPTSMYSSF